MTMDISITGLEGVLDKMSELSTSVQKRILEASARAALKPVVADVRAHCPVDQGALRKSIGVKKAKRVAAGEMVLSVGARRGFGYTDNAGVYRDPFYYSIPVEYGHVVKSRTTGQAIGFVAPVGMFRGAYERGRIKVVEDFQTELNERIEAALA